MTVICLVSVAVLITFGLSGLVASRVLTGLLLVSSAVLYVYWPELSVGSVYGIDIDNVLEALWLVPAVSAVPLVLEPGASPAELEALGGIVGLVGMTNYFLRPLCVTVYRVVRWLDQWSNGR